MIDSIYHAACHAVFQSLSGVLRSESVSGELKNNI